MPSRGEPGSSLAHAVEQAAELRGRGDVAPEDDDAAGLDVVEQLARLGVEFGAGKPDVEELSDLLFEGEGEKVVVISHAKVPRWV